MIVAERGKEAMTTQRVSRLQNACWAVAGGTSPPSGGDGNGYRERVKALAGDQSNISYSLRTLETRGWIVIGRTRGGRAESFVSPRQGSKKPQEFV